MIQVERGIDELNYERFEFMFIDKTLYLNNYYLFTRENKMKRKWSTVRKYERLSKRDSTIEESDVELSMSVKTEALEKLKASITCKKWSER